MTDVFISYSAKDKKLAEQIHQMVEDIGYNVFMASTSLRVGEVWSSAILDDLQEAKIVIFIASKHACKSPYVLQEVGHAIGEDKILFPLLIDITPEQLPGWLKDYYAVDIRQAGIKEIETELRRHYRFTTITSNAIAFTVGAIAGYAYRKWKEHKKEIDESESH